MKKLLISLLSLFIAVDAIAERPTPQCIEDSKEAIVNKVKEIAGPDLTQEYISNNIDKFFGPVSEIVSHKCSDDITKQPAILEDISQIPMIKIPFQDNSKYYELNVSSTGLLDYITIPTLILVTKTDLKKKPGDSIAFSEMPRSYFFNEYCSDHEVAFNIDDDAPVNVAGQASFPGYSDEEFFIDFPIGSSTRAFPGLIIANTTPANIFSDDIDRILWFKNFAIGNKAAKDFANALSGSKCSNDNLQIYVVTTNDKEALTKTVLAGLTITEMTSVYVLAGPYLIK